MSDAAARAAEHAQRFLASLPTRPVARAVDLAELRAAFGGPLPEEGASASAVIDALVTNASTTEADIDQSLRAILAAI